MYFGRTHLLTLNSFLFLVMLFSVTTVCAQEHQLAGQWDGTLDVKVTKLRLQLMIEGQQSSPSGKLISLDQGKAEMTFDTFSIDGDTLEFSIKRAGANYSGKIAADGKSIEGTFKQAGQNFPLKFTKTGKAIRLTLTQVWTGEMKAGPQSFDFQFRVYQTDEGEMSVLLDSFTEGITIGAELNHEGDQVTLTIPVTNAKFIGKLNESMDVCEGAWNQRGKKFPLTLKRVPNEQVRKLTKNRPQTPKPPFAYHTEDFNVKVSEINKEFDAETELAGTLTSPKTENKYPTVILISGSGPQDRDETIFEHKPFFVISDHLAKVGYTVIRYDERGIGESKGNFGQCTSLDFSYDVEALVEWAARHPRVDASRIILCGHSEGGLIAPMVAVRNEKVAGIVLMAGPGVSGEEIIINQSRLMAEAMGAPAEDLDTQQTLLKNVLPRIKSGQPLDDEFKKTVVKKVTDAHESTKAEDIEVAFDTIKGRLSGPWMKYFVNYQPQENLTKVRCPVLAVTGKKDLQVDPELNMPKIKEHLATAGNQNVEMVELESLNHLFQECETGAATEYTNIEQTLSPALLKTLTEWLDKHFKN